MHHQSSIKQVGNEKDSYSMGRTDPETRHRNSGKHYRGGPYSGYRNEKHMFD